MQRYKKLFQWEMPKIHQTQCTVNGDLVSLMEGMAVDGTKLIVDIHVEAVAADHADLAQSDCGDGGV